MKIVVLDGYTLNPGDLSWKDLEEFGEYTVYDRTDPDQLVERAQGVQVLLINKVVLDREAMKQLPELAYIGILATGYNIVDVEAARELDIVITNVPAYGTDSVAQHVFALLLELVNKVGKYDREVRAGKWSQSPDFSFHKFSTTELAGLTMGIVGYGAIGKAVANIARAFGMNVIVNTRTPGNDEGVRFDSLETVFTDSDIVSLHCPLTRETKGLVNQDRLDMMKKTAYLINTSRGPIVDEAALTQTLNYGGISGAGLDVLSVEPPPENNPIFDARNCVITPHVAWATLAARKRLMDTVVGNLKKWMEGKPENVVNF